MNVRIRYSKMNDGAFVSMRVIKSNKGKEYRSYISPDGLTGSIKEATNTEPLVATIKGTSSHKVKIALKNALEVLGCVFQEETRRKHA